MEFKKINKQKGPSEDASASLGGRRKQSLGTKEVSGGWER